jgi:DNA-binding transcriptional regulator YiaG
MSATEFKKLRAKKGYSQSELARLFEVTVMTISRWETGRRKVPHYALIALESLPKKESKPK